MTTSATRTVAKDISQENREDHPVVQHLQRRDELKASTPDLMAEAFLCLVTQ